MALLRIYKYPHPVLRIKAQPLDVFGPDLASCQDLIDDMIETMYNQSGAIGLAAPQVGYSLRIVVLDMAAKQRKLPNPPPDDPTAADSANSGQDERYQSELKVLINPEIIEQSRNKVMREGCLSFPEYLASVRRSTKLTYQAYDRQGVLQTYQVRDLEAIAIQHEIDHLDGILMIDRIESLKTDLIRRHPGPSPKAQA